MENEKNDKNFLNEFQNTLIKLSTFSQTFQNEGQTKYPKEFLLYLKRVIIRNINQELWLIDPSVSYLKEKAIILRGNIKYINNKIDLIQHKLVPLIYKKFLEINDNRVSKKNKSYDYCLNTVYPLKVGIELTGKCNFQCIHCYAKPLRQLKEPSYKQIISLIDNLYENGVLFLWFTGGECTLRSDFHKIYEYSKKKGFIVSIVSNGSLLLKFIELFKKYPPKMIKLSQYGASREEYKNITGNGNNYEKFLVAVEALVDNKINFTIQSVVLKNNYRSLDLMKNFCGEKDIMQNINTLIVPRLNGDLRPKNHQVDDNNLSHFSNLNNDIKKIYNMFKSEKAFRKNLTDKGEYFCKVGISECFITVDLKLCFCIMFRDKYLKYNNKIPFMEQFKTLNLLRGKALILDDICKNCEALLICNICPFYKKIFTKTGEIKQKCQDIKNTFNLISSKNY